MPQAYSHVGLINAARRLEGTGVNRRPADPAGRRRLTRRRAARPAGGGVHRWSVVSRSSATSPTATVSRPPGQLAPAGAPPRTAGRSPRSSPANSAAVVAGGEQLGERGGLGQLRKPDLEHHLARVRLQAVPAGELGDRRPSAEPARGPGRPPAGCARPATVACPPATPRPAAASGSSARRMPMPSGSSRVLRPAVAPGLGTVQPADHDARDDGQVAEFQDGAHGAAGDHRDLRAEAGQPWSGSTAHPRPVATGSGRRRSAPGCRRNRARSARRPARRRWR